MVVACALLKFQTSPAARGKRKSTPGSVSNRRVIQWGYVPGNVPAITAATFREMDARGEDTQDVFFPVVLFHPLGGSIFSFCFVPPLAGNKQKGEMVRGDGAQGPLQGLRGRVRPQEVDHQ